MRGVNKVFLIGRIGRDPETKLPAGGGAPWGNFSLATNRPKRDGDVWVEETDWHYVKVFGKEAEYAQKYLRKGALCAVEGTVVYERWTSHDGVKHTATRILADRVSMLVHPPQREAAAPVEAAPGELPGPGIEALAK